jgi:hypothetical protein
MQTPVCQADYGPRLVPQLAVRFALIAMFSSIFEEENQPADQNDSQNNRYHPD